MNKGIAAICLLAIGIAIGGFMERCSTPQASVVTIRDTVPGDSVPYPVPVSVPVPYLVQHTDTILQEVDTTAILASYFAKHYYADTLKNDTSAFIALKETITQNRIVERSLMFQNRRPTAITTTTLPPPSERKLQFYGHVFLGKEMAAPVVQVGWKEWQVSAGYNLQQGGIIVGVGYRFR